MTRILRAGAIPGEPAPPRMYRHRGCTDSLARCRRKGLVMDIHRPHVIVGKLLWACGFNVTDDHVVLFRPEDLVLAPDAKDHDVFGNKRPLDRGELDARLAGLGTA